MGHGAGTWVWKRVGGMEDAIGRVDGRMGCGRGGRADEGCSDGWVVVCRWVFC